MTPSRTKVSAVLRSSARKKSKNTGPWSSPGRSDETLRRPGSPLRAERPRPGSLQLARLRSPSSSCPLSLPPPFPFPSFRPREAREHRTPRPRTVPRRPPPAPRATPPRTRPRRVGGAAGPRCSLDPRARTKECGEGARRRSAGRLAAQVQAPPKGAPCR